jgi:hypothetical protein
MDDAWGGVSSSARPTFDERLALRIDWEEIDRHNAATQCLSHERLRQSASIGVLSKQFPRRLIVTE